MRASARADFALLYGVAPPIAALPFNMSRRESDAPLHGWNCRFVRLIERGQLDLQSMITSTWRLDQVRQALQVLSDRTEMCPGVTFT